MNRSHAFAFVLIILMSLCIVTIKPANGSEDSWTQKSPMHQARGYLGVAVVEGKIYAIGGSTAGGQWPVSGGFVSTNEEYDPVMDTWTTKTPMPTPRRSFAMAVYQGRIYCIGGMNNAVTGANQVYDPVTDTWENKTAMPTARFALKANVVDDKIYLIGGYSNGYLNVNEVYDPKTDTWATNASMPSKASSYASATVDNIIHIVGGYTDPPVFVLKQNQVYDPLTDMWSQGAVAPYSVADGAAAATTGVLAPKRIYVIGVQGFSGPSAPPCLNQVYDPETNTWENGTAMPTNRIDFDIAIVNDMLYVVGGFTYDVLGFINPSAVNEQYTPIEYGTPDPTYQSPSPSPIPSQSPTPTISPSQSPSPTSTPSQSPTVSPSPSASQQPTQTPEPPASNLQAQLIYGIAVASAAVVIVAVAAVMLKKRRK